MRTAKSTGPNRRTLAPQPGVHYAPPQASSGANPDGATMKERGILFSAPMVRALLDGTKTVTRRVIKPQPSGDVDNLGDGETLLDMASGRTIRCPYGVVGDRLWIRETFYCDDFTYKSKPDDDAQRAEFLASMYYRADAERTGTICELIPECLCDGQSPWKPGIHMPRWASRITLEIVDIRAERLHQITEDEARAEGVERYDDDGVRYYGPLNKGHACATVAFERLWHEINGEESWKANPWVWVVGFSLFEAP